MCEGGHRQRRAQHQSQPHTMAQKKQKQAERAAAPKGPSDQPLVGPPTGGRTRTRNQEIRMVVRMSVAVVLAAVMLDKNYPIETLMGWGPGFSGRSPVQPGVKTPSQVVPDNIPAPPWGHPGAHQNASSRGGVTTVYTPAELEAMRDSGLLASRALDLARSLIKPGVTTDEIDQQVHRFIIEEGAYPSPLQFKGFPKSICTSVNEVMVHGVPDSRPLQDGDIINVDVTVFLNGYHADTSATFHVGSSNEKTRALLKATRDALEAAVAACGPGKPLNSIGKAVQAVADAGGWGTANRFVGHGVGTSFHGKPRVHAFAPKKHWKDVTRWLQVVSSQDYFSTIQPGQTFTIEPILIEPGGSGRVRPWDDRWTMAAVDGSLNAQFEYTVVVQEPGEGPGQGGCEVLTPYLWEQTATQ